MIIKELYDLAKAAGIIVFEPHDDAKSKNTSGSSPMSIQLPLRAQADK
jgi:hypothetical protein